jgi:hypothetical protein
MPKLWLIKGDLDASGWNVLRKDYEDEKVEIVHLDPKVWAMIDATDPPTGYEGLMVVEPADGLYLDPNGSPMYLVDGSVVKTAEEVIAALGDEALELLEEIGDAHTVLQRMGRAF